MNDETLLAHCAAEAVARLLSQLHFFSGVPEGFEERLIKTHENLTSIIDDGVTVGQVAEALVAKFGPTEN